MSECIKYCGQCKKTDLPNIRDKEPVHIGYSYAYKTDCEGNAYIKAEEVKSLIEQAKADAIKDFLKETGKYIYYMDKYTDFEGQMISIENLNLIAEQQIKEQK